MSSMTREQFKTILVMAKHMASSDQEFHPMEKKVLMAMFKAMDITHEEQNTMKTVSLKDAIKSIVSDEAKNTLIDVLILMASADGKFEENEQEFIYKVMSHLHMDPSKHAYFKKDGALDLANVRHNVKNIMSKIKASMDNLKNKETHEKPKEIVKGEQKEIYDEPDPANEIELVDDKTPADAKLKIDDPFNLH